MIDVTRHNVAVASHSMGKGRIGSVRRPKLSDGRHRLCLGFRLRSLQWQVVPGQRGRTRRTCAIRTTNGPGRTTSRLVQAGDRMHRQGLFRLPRPLRERGGARCASPHLIAAGRFISHVLLPVVGAQAVVQALQALGLHLQQPPVVQGTVRQRTAVAVRGCAVGIADSARKGCRRRWGAVSQQSKNGGWSGR